MEDHLSVVSHLEHACGLRDPDLPHVLEFGVYRGASVWLLRDRLPDDVRIYGFDSFEGLPEDWRDAKGRLVGPCVRRWFATDGIAPDVPGVVFYTGWFEDTIPHYLRIAAPVGLLHVDCDLYASTRTALDGVGHLLRPGSIVVLDEWFYNENPGCDDHEQRAFKEWAERNDRDYELVPFGPGFSEQQIVRITR